MAENLGQPPQQPLYPITLWDVYQAVEAIDRRLIAAEVATKADDAVRVDHEVRLRTLEKMAYGIPAALIIAVASIVARFIK